MQRPKSGEELELGFELELEGVVLEIPLPSQGVFTHQYASDAVLLMYCGEGALAGFMV